jgi:hypothetical protein
MNHPSKTTVSFMQVPRTDPMPRFIPSGNGRDSFHRLTENYYGKGQATKAGFALRDYPSIQSQEGGAINCPPSCASPKLAKSSAGSTVSLQETIQRKMQLSHSSRLSSPKFSRPKSSSKRHGLNGMPFRN